MNDMVVSVPEISPLKITTFANVKQSPLAV